MIVKTKVGNFEIIKDYREAFNQEQFEERYVDVAFDKYQYIVGDISSGILRLKGFDDKLDSDQTYKKIPDYLNEYTQVNSAYFILKRIVKKEGK